MCTAATYKTKDHYFGRTLDYEISYGEIITITPRNYPFKFSKVRYMNSHYAMIGVASVVDNYPLYFDATNEEGLSMAGLNFPENADYKPEIEGKDNVAPFEFIPWILGQCATVAEAKNILSNMNLVKIAFSEQLPLAPLHWIISDRNESITVESVAEGLKIYNNPVGILTNNPPFDMQMFNLNNYMNLSIQNPSNHFAKDLKLDTYSRGMGALGLPGDLSSMSRFVKVAFTKMNSCSGDSEKESISQFFHILGSVEQQRGCVVVGEGQYEVTIYTSCCNTDKGIYYYTTYENNQITGVDMHKENLNSDKLVTYPIIKEQQIRMEN
jgi:choloylglycine hydrolase